MSKKNERLNRLVEILEQQNGVPIRDLALMLDVSEMTVRRDLETLKASNIVLDIPGAAVLNPQRMLGADDEQYHLSMATRTHIKEKERIGRHAASLIEPEDCIIIDNGSTVEYLADNIPRDMRLTVVTCNLNILNKICTNPNISIIFGGGYFHADTMSFESQESIRMIENVRATKVFVSAAGVHDSMGVTCMSNYELRIKQTIIRSGAEKILVTDSSKFGVIKPCFLTDLDIFDRIITDRDLSEEWRQTIQEKGILLETV